MFDENNVFYWSWSSSLKYFQLLISFLDVLFKSYPMSVRVSVIYSTCHFFLLFHNRSLRTTGSEEDIERYGRPVGGSLNLGFRFSRSIFFLTGSR